MSKRKAFKFYGSYYNVAKELPEKDRLKFIWAILQKQFENIDPVLDGMVKFAYTSQLHSITSQVEGYISKCKDLNINAFDTPSEGGVAGGSEGGVAQVQEKGKEEEKEQINFVGLLGFINQSFGKQFKVINETVRSKYNARLKDGYCKEDFFNAITNASKDNFHKENKFQYCTPEFFSRSATLDKYGFKSKQEKPVKIVVPHYNESVKIDIGDGTFA